MKFKVWLENAGVGYIFLDLDETLVKTIPTEQVAEKRQRVNDLQKTASSSPLAAAILKNHQRDLSWYGKGISIKITEGVERIVMPRPYLRECLQQLESFGVLCILTSAGSLYARTIIKSLNLGQLFGNDCDRVYSLNSTSIPQVADRLPWVIVDDLESSFGHKCKLVGVNLNPTGFDNDETIYYRLEHIKSQHHVPIKPFNGDDADKELLSLPAKIKAKLI